jgi:SAM-dependent methyltransferase
MAAETFNELTEIYEAMIDWPRRLGNEKPFYRSWFDRAAVESVVDVACGTGRHAAMFHEWNLRVEGSDLSPNMIARATNRFGQSEKLHWAVRGFDEPVEPVGSFDAVVCVGNSLALAPNKATIERAISQMFAAVGPGGLVIVHVLNLWHMPDGPCVWQKCQRSVLPQGDVLILKGVHRCDGRGYVDLIVSRPACGALVYSESVPFLGIEADELQSCLRTAGASTTHCFGDYHERPYDRAESIDLLVVAEK